MRKAVKWKYISINVMLESQAKKKRDRKFSNRNLFYSQYVND